MPVPPKIQFDFALQICDGMHCLAEHKILQCDFAAGNILVTEDGKTLKVTDFGLSLRSESGVEFLDSNAID